MKLFYDFNNPVENEFCILEKIINSKYPINMIKIPENFEKIKKVKLTSFENLKKIDLKKLGKVIFEFEPKGILKINKEIIKNNLEKIFFKIGSEHEFSLRADELTSEEYDEIIGFLTEDRLKLNMEAEECLKTLLIYSKIIEFEIKIPKKSEDIIIEICNEKINSLNNLIPKLKEKNEDYTNKMRKALEKILKGEKSEIISKTFNFINEFDLFVFSKNNLLEKLFLNLYDKYNLSSKEDLHKIFIIKEFIYHIRNINEKEVIQFLCKEEPNFEIKNLYEKLKKYNNPFLFIEFTPDLFTESMLGEKNILKYFDFSPIEKNIRIFLQNISPEKLKNFLKLFLFCSRDEILITQEQIKEIFPIYLNFKAEKTEIKKKVSSDFETKEILFNKKIEFLLIMFEEKLKNLRINDEPIKEYKEIREIPYKKIREKYINNILKTKYDLEIEFKSEIYEEKIKNFNQEKGLKKLKKYLEKNKEKTEDEEDLYKVIQVIEIPLKEKNKCKAGRKTEKKNLFQNNYLEDIKSFSFSNLFRTGIYYKILILNYLFTIDKKDFTIEAQILKKGNKEETSENSEKNFQIYYNALMRNNKQFGEKHLKYLFYYLVKKENKLIFNVINCLNFLHLYDDNLLESVVNLETFETLFPFYEEVTLKEINSK